MTDTEWQLEMLAKIGADTRRLLNSMRQQGSEELIAATVAIATALIEKVSDPIASGTPEAGKAVEVKELLASRPSGNVPDKGAPK